MLRSWAFGFLAALVVCVFVAGSALAERRVALLIGNADYAGTSMDLFNPINDVTALGAALGELGFDVVVQTDGTAQEMRQALLRFGREAEGADMAIVFFAGHGVRFAGDNLLVGTSFDGQSGERLPAESLAMREIRAVLEAARPKAGLIILDACRDTPITDAGVARSGLVRTRGGAGLLIAYATDPGNVAFDGAGENSAFTAALLRHLKTPGLDIRLMLGRVRQEVVVDTYGQQVPWVEEALIGDHVLSTAEDAVPDDPLAREVRHWRTASASGDPDAIRGFLATWPGSDFAQIARDRLVAPEAAGPGGGSEAVSLLLAAATAQKLRTDLVALRSVNRLLNLSRQTLEEIEEIAVRSPEAAAPVLDQARRDLTAIEYSRQLILLRLDASRGYYSDLVAEGARMALREARGAGRDG